MSPSTPRQGIFRFSTAHVAWALVFILVLSGASVFASGNLLPAAHAGPDQSGSVGATLGFSANASQDPDGTIVSYAWNFGDGGTATGPYATHAFANVGTFEVRLNVTDNNGGVGTDTATAFICPSLRNALDSAAPGSVLQIQPCTYTETLVVNKSVTLRGAPGVVFEGRIGQPSNRNGPVLTVAAPDVTIRDVNISNWNGDAIRAQAQWRVRLVNLSMSGNGAIDVSSSDTVVIEASRTATVNAYRATSVTISGTSFTDGSFTEALGLRLTDSNANSVSFYGASGHIDRSQFGYVSGSGNLTIEDSRIGGFNLGAGITLRSNVISPPGCCSSFSGPGTIQSNTFSNGGSPIYINGPGTVVRFNNIMSGNTLLLTPSSSQSFVYLNNFYNSYVSDDGFQNRFDTGSLGNYWANHTAPDANNDSVRDSPFNISGSAASQDRYPLFTPFGGLTTSERAPDVTSASDALVDAKRGILIPIAGLVSNATYDLTITNITPIGAGFGYAYASPDGTLILLRPDGSPAGASPMYSDGLRTGKKNVTFASVGLDVSGRWTLESDGFTVANFTVGINWYAPTSAPNPTGGNTTARALDLQDMRITFPLEARVELGHSHDFTVTNGTLSPGSGLYQLYAPNGTPLSGVEPYVDGLHPGRTNGTFPAIAFPAVGLWTVRGPNNAIYAAFEVDAPPGVPPFVTELQLTMTNRSDSAAFGVAVNATDGFDAEIDTTEPPAPADSQHVRLYFTGPNSTELHRSVLGRAPARSWNLTAQESGLVGGANLSWNSAAFSAIPPTFDVELVDGAATTDMRLASTYAFDISGTHTLQVRIRQTAGLRLDANALIVTPVVSVGASLFVNGAVINDGPDVAFDVRATLEFDNGTTLTVNADPPTLAAGATSHFSFPGVTQTAPGNHVVTIRVNSNSADNNLANNIATRPYFVANRTIEIEILGSNSTSIAPATNTSYAVQVTNTGNGNESFTLVVAGTPNSWSSSLSATNLTLSSNASLVVQLNVTAPTSELADPIAHISVEGFAVADPTARDMAHSTTTLSISRDLVLADGWSLVSIPILPANASAQAVFGSSVLATYSWNGTSYTLASTISPGRGYWVYSNGTILRSISGVPQRNVSLLLTAGWNLVGTPLSSTNLSSAPGNVSRSAFTWNLSGYEERTILSPFSGYWVYAHNTSASIQLGVGLALVTIPVTSPGAEFALDIRLTVPTGQHDMVAVGAQRTASASFGAEDTPKMPISPVTSSLRATLAPAPGGEGRALHRDVRASGPHHAWALDVERRGVDGIIEVRWDATKVAKIPATYRVELQDGLVRLDMRLIDRYDIVTPTANGHHALQLVISTFAEFPECLAALDEICVSPGSASSVQTVSPIRR